MSTVIIDYGAGNVTSLKFALERLGMAQVVVSNDAAMIRKADRVFFPGVGHAAFAMQKLRKKELNLLIPQLKQPVLGVCLGMQLMCNSSEEGATDGMGIFDVAVRRFDQSEKVPHIGWNHVNFLNNSELNDQWFYFVHSYFAETGKDTIGVATYGHQVISAVLRNDNFWACQFHPEKSGDAGRSFLKNFIDL